MGSVFCQWLKKFRPGTNVPTDNDITPPYPVSIPTGVVELYDGTVVTPMTDLHKLLLSTRLTKHFTLGEMVASQTATRLDIDNFPAYEQFRQGVEFAQVLLEPLRLAFGPVYSSSWNRVPALNNAIGGSKTSAHMYGVAMDHRTRHTVFNEMNWWIRGNLPYDQVIFEFGRWIHVGWKTPTHPTPRRQALMAFRVNGKTIYYPYNPRLINTNGTGLR